MQTIFILCSYSSGSSAITGFLEKCGAHTCPPHYWTRDSQTKVSYENIALKEKLESLFPLDSSPMFQQKGDLQTFSSFFSKWYAMQKVICKGIGKHIISIKHPLTVFVLEQILQTVDNPHFIILTRPLEEIENTRLRRNWTEVYGRKGAQIIYEKISEHMDKIKNNSKTPVFEISYHDLCNNEKQRNNLVSFCDFTIDSEKLKTASQFLRK